MWISNATRKYTRAAIGRIHQLNFRSNRTCSVVGVCMYAYCFDSFLFLMKNETDCFLYQGTLQMNVVGC